MNFICFTLTDNSESAVDLMRRSVAGSTAQGELLGLLWLYGLGMKPSTAPAAWAKAAVRMKPTENALMPVLCRLKVATNKTRLQLKICLNKEEIRKVVIH